LKINKILTYANSFSGNYRDFPVSLHIEVTDHCFNQCPMCGHWKKKEKKNLDIDKFKQIVLYGVNHGLESICLTGGDPLWREDIDHIMDFLSHHLTFGIVTAGHIGNHVSLSYLRKAKWVRVSLDAITPDIYERSRGGEISQHHVINGIKRMLEAGVNVELGITIHKLNISDLNNILDFASTNRIKVSARTVYNHSSNMNLSKMDFLLAQSLCNHYEVDFTGKFIPKPIRNCWAARYQHFIRSNGDVYPCCILAGDTESFPKVEVKFSNIYDKSPYNYNRMIVNSKRFSEYRTSDVTNICNANCIKRLNNINTVVNDTIGKANFF
jgi:radical SAM protein with 4Fe4S-binding SPASM domain